MASSSSSFRLSSCSAGRAWDLHFPGCIAIGAWSRWGMTGLRFAVPGSREEGEAREEDGCACQGGWWRASLWRATLSFTPWQSDASPSSVQDIPLGGRQTVLQKITYSGLATGSLRRLAQGPPLIQPLPRPPAPQAGALPGSGGARPSASLGSAGPQPHVPHGSPASLPTQVHPKPLP